MTTTTIKETADIFKRLSPQKQAYFMTLLRVAEAAENAIKSALIEQSRVILVAKSVNGADFTAEPSKLPLDLPVFPHIQQ